MTTDVIIIGGGIAGITAARTLHDRGVSFILLEASDRLGGRIKTDEIEGFKLDHGFQVLLTAYPEAQRWLDYEKLDLKSFLPGALLLKANGKQERIGDPLRDLSSLFPTLFSNAGSIGDKMKILNLKQRLSKLSVEEIFQQEELPTNKVLSQEYGFSQKMIDTFFRPFFSGIFLETDLQTSRRMFDFVFKMFGKGFAAVPNHGMEAIPKQLAEPLPGDRIYLNSRVTKIDGHEVIVSDGSTYNAPNIIMATEATGLVKDYSSTNSKYQSTTHIHFTTENPPITKPIIALNTNAKKVFNNICTINQVAPGYASNGKSLVSLSVIGNHHFTETELIQHLRKELETWFGKEVQNWTHLHSRQVQYSLPDQKKVSFQEAIYPQKVKEGLFICGDHLYNGSINAAMKSGYETAKLIKQ